MVDRREAWAWDADQVLLQLVDADGDGSGSWKLADRYLYGAVLDMVLADEQLPGGGIALNSVSSTAGTVLWPLGDQLGSVRDLVDSNGVIREHVVYDSFGRQLSETDFDSAGTAIASSSPLAVDTLFGFTGREWDADTELQYNRARWYDPAQGRWLGQDPLGFGAGDVNLYRYVDNGPTNGIDPSGLEDGGGPPDWRRFGNYQQWQKAEGNYWTRVARRTQYERGIDFLTAAFEVSHRHFEEIAMRKRVAKSHFLDRQAAQPRLENGHARLFFRSREEVDSYYTECSLRELNPWLQGLATFFLPADVNPHQTNLDVWSMMVGGFAQGLFPNRYDQKSRQEEHLSPNLPRT